MKKALALALCIALCAATLVTGTVAFFTDEEKQTNVFSVGYVDILQHEQKRTDNDALVDYDNENPPKLYPLVDKQNGEPTTKEKDFDGEVDLLNPDRFGGFADKIVTVENKGKNAAYIRNIVAIPTGGTTETWLHHPFCDVSTGTNSDWAQPYKVSNVEINNIEYNLFVFDYIGSDNPDPTSTETIPAGHFQPTDKTMPTLLSFYLDSAVDFEENITGTAGAYTDPDGNSVETVVMDGTTLIGAYYYLKADDTREYLDITNLNNNNILVATQAVQVDGFTDFTQAFANTFNGPITNDNHPWYKGGSGSNPPPAVSYAGKTADDEEYSWDDLLTNDLVKLSPSDANAIIYIDKSIAELYIPEGITSIGSSAAKDNTNLKKVEFPSTLTHIHSYSFYNTGLESVTIPANVRFSNDHNTDSDNFANCASLTSVTIENGVNLIPNSCFKNCTALSSVSIPESITELCTSAFRNCSSLTSIQLPKKLNTEGFKASTAFRETPIANNAALILWY